MRYFLILLCSALLVLSGCKEDDFCLIGSGQLNTYLLEVGEFEKIALEGPVNLLYTQSDSFKVEVVCEQEMYADLSYSVKNRKLEIGYEGNVRCFETDFGVWVNISAPEIKSISAFGSSTIKSQGDITQSSMSLIINGSGKVELAGQVDEQYIDITGSGTVHNFDLLSEKTEINVSGSGDCEVTCTQNLNIDVDGSADISYKGSPQISKKVKGSLKLNAIN